MKNSILKIVIVGLLVVAAGYSQAEVVRFFNITERDTGGSAKDADGANFTLSGFEAVPVDVTTPAGGPYLYERTITLSNIDFATGLVGGTDSFTFDINYAAATGAKLDFRGNTGLILSTSDQVTYTIDNFVVTSGSGSVSFAEFNAINVRNHTGVTETLTVYDGVGTAGAVLVSELGSATANIVHGFSTLDSSITATFDGVVAAYSNGVSFELDVIPEPATIGTLALGGLVVALVRRRIR